MRPVRISNRFRSGLAAVALAVAAGSLSSCSTTTPGTDGGVKDRAQPARAGENMLAIADRTLASGDVNSALDLYRQAASSADKSPEALLRLGQLLFARGEYDYAAGAFSETLIRQPKNGEALRGLGMAQLAQGQLDDAERNIEQAVRADVSVRSIEDLAVLRMLQGDPDEAGMVYQKALARWPQELNLRSNFALSDALSEKCERALKTGREAATSPFARPQHVAAFALVLALCGHDQEARIFGRKAMSDVGVDKLLDQAAAARQAGSMAERAAAIGVVPASESGVLAPVGKPFTAGGPGGGPAP